MRFLAKLVANRMIHGRNWSRTHTRGCNCSHTGSRTHIRTRSRSGNHTHTNTRTHTNLVVILSYPHSCHRGRGRIRSQVRSTTTYMVQVLLPTRQMLLSYFKNPCRSCSKSNGSEYLHYNAVLLQPARSASNDVFARERLGKFHHPSIYYIQNRSKQLSHSKIS